MPLRYSQARDAEPRDPIRSCEPWNQLVTSRSTLPNSNRALRRTAYLSRGHAHQFKLPAEAKSQNAASLLSQPSIHGSLPSQADTSVSVDAR